MFYPNSKEKLMDLMSKGGLLIFTIERPDRVYKGTILLSPVENHHQKRAVYIKEYKTALGLNAQGE